MELKQGYALDALIATVRAISDAEPVYFQRDGEFYAVSDRGFGKLSHGLSLKPQNPDNESWRQELPEILNSSSCYQKPSKKQIKTKEKRYLNPLTFHIDSNGAMTLDSLAVTAKKMQCLPNDDNIRMVNHGYGYRSHKYGYAADGTDTSLLEARVMNVDRYIELMREKEDQFFAQLSRADEIEISKAYESSNIQYSRWHLEIPSAFVLTPSFMVTFPRRGRLNYNNRHQGWDSTTYLHNEPTYEGIRIYDNAPFALFYTLAPQEKSARQSRELEKKLLETLTAISDGLAALKIAKPFIQSFLDKMNTAHETVNKERIEWYAELSKTKVHK